MSSNLLARFYQGRLGRFDPQFPLRQLPRNDFGARALYVDTPLSRGRLGWSSCCQTG
jgi:hypothetical protein